MLLVKRFYYKRFYAVKNTFAQNITNATDDLFALRFLFLSYTWNQSLLNITPINIRLIYFRIILQTFR